MQQLFCGSPTGAKLANRIDDDRAATGDKKRLLKEAAQKLQALAPKFTKSDI